ncbi:MAG TPA: TlpA disulfide reductase family protein [Steroidobacteraceae bacterium]|nr:TlpA disulfide reductase family protein [Steroidobacteraceae bacterium]
MRFEPSLSHRRERRLFLKGFSACLVCGGLRGTPAWAGGLHVGAPAPPATLVTIDGQRISTSELRGQVVILTFWATWCSPCRDELPLLSDYLATHAAAGLRILGFSLDTKEDLAKVRRVAQSLHFPVGLMSDSSAPGYGRIWRLPVSFTIDRQGLLAEDGWKEKKPAWTRERLDQLVAPLLASA